MISKFLFKKMNWDIGNKIHIDQYIKYYKLKIVHNFMRCLKKKTGTIFWDEGSNFLKPKL